MVSVRQDPSLGTVHLRAPMHRFSLRVVECLRTLIRYRWKQAVLFGEDVAFGGVFSLPAELKPVMGEGGTEGERLG